MALIECSACKNSVSPEAVSCPHCGQPLKPMSEPKQKGGCLRALLIVLGGLALLFLLMLGCSIFAVMGSKGNHSGPASSSDPVPAPAGPVLKVGNWHWGEEYGYVTAEGRVTNISTEKLENVEAVVTFETKGGTVVTTEDGVIEFQVSAQVAQP